MSDVTDVFSPDPADFDSPWKDAITHAFEPFLALLFPHVHSAIDWSRGYEPLDKELQKLHPLAETGEVFVNFLAKVWRLDGDEAWILVHVEVQSQPDPAFGLRMFRYNYRLFDVHRRPVVSLAVLADNRPTWKPTEYVQDVLGCQTRFRYPTVKLIELEADRPALEQSENLFATVELAHLDALATAGDPDRRAKSKIDLIRRLYRPGLTREQVYFLCKIIDWMLKLPKKFDAIVLAEVENIERENQMPYVTSFEELGIEKGLKQGVEQGLLQGIETALPIRFGDAGEALMTEIRTLSDTEKLGAILKALRTTSSLDEVRSLWL